MLFQAGLRPSELVTLRYSDVDGDEIIIRRYYSDKANEIKENRTKAGHGFRRIILTSLAKEIIEAAKQRQLEEGIENPEYIFMMNEQIAFVKMKPRMFEARRQFVCCQIDRIHLVRRFRQ